MRAPRAALLAHALLGATLLAGCTYPEEGNPHLAAPKLLVDAASATETEIYVHSAVGERRYDRLVLSINNETVADRTASYAILHRTTLPRFHANVEVRHGEAHYRFQATFDLADPERAVVIPVVDGRTEDAEVSSLPYDKFIPNVAEASR